MGEITVVCAVLILLLDVLIIVFVRDLLMDFLIGKAGRKKAKSIHRAQNMISKIDMKYITSYLNNYKKEFKKYHLIYLSELISVIPQYLLIGLMLLSEFDKSVYIVGLICIIKMIVFLIVRFPSWPNYKSKFAGKR